MWKDKLKIKLFFWSIIFFITGCEDKDHFIKTEGMIWNTVYHITYNGSSHLQDSIISVLNRVSSSLSVFDTNSIVSHLNVSDSIIADKHLISVYDASLRIHALSEGRFDPTVSPLVEAWGFGRNHKPSSDTVAIDSILTFVGIEKTHKKGKMIIKDDKRTNFNFSAIAKGYGCDMVGEMFKRNGVSDFMVEIGGEITLSGKSPTGKDWKIAVDTPIEGNSPGEDTAIILSLTDAGLATSGNYRNYSIEGTVKLVHTISPKTGRPFIGEILSATVIAPSCMEADAIATACMASNREEAKELFKLTNTEGLLIFRDSLWVSPGFNKYIISEVSELGKIARK